MTVPVMWVTLIAAGAAAVVAVIAAVVQVLDKLGTLDADKE
jgi:hypothetical protein